jgi:hypothetical protein
MTGKVFPCNRLFLIIFAIQFLISCAHYRDVPKILDSARGRIANNIDLIFPYSKFEYVRLLENGNKALRYEYDGSQGCIWEFTIDTNTERILDWKFIDAAAERKCKYLALSMP